MHKQALILTAATEEIDQLNRLVDGLIERFNGDEGIQSFLRDYGS